MKPIAGRKLRRSTGIGAACAALALSFSPALPAQTAPTVTTTEVPRSAVDAAAPAVKLVPTVLEVPPTPPVAVPAAGAVAPPPVDPNRITFELKIPAQRGGGTVSGSAAELESFGEDQVSAHGAVEIHYKDVVVHAERLTLSRDTMTVQAEGDVVFDQGPQRIAGERVDFDLEQRTGTFWQATAYVHPDYYFSGDIISKTGPKDFEVDHGVFTSCTGDITPDWSIAMSSADVMVDGYAHIRNARLKVKKLPVFYWPYMVWPAKTDRTSGLLVPNIGYSKRRGEYLGLAWYQVLGPSYDNTLYLDAYTEGFYGAGDEFRYRPTDKTKGNAKLYFFHNEDLAKDAWRFDWAHVTENLPFGLRGVVSVEHYSDFETFRDFERSEGQNTRRFLYSNAFVSGNWGAQSLNILVDQRETFLSDDEDTVTQRQLPEIQYNLREFKLGASPLYLSVGATGNFLQAKHEGFFDASYGRFDLAPELKLPLRPAPWLSVALTAGGRATWWGDSFPTFRVNPETGVREQVCGDRVVDGNQFYCGDTLTRATPNAGAELVGPSFSKIFDANGKTFSKFKHIIEPRWSYGYVGQFDDQSRVAQFDEIDRLTSSDLASVSIVNRLLAKPADTTKGGAFEILSLEVGQNYSLDTEQPLQSSRNGLETSQSSAIFSKLRFNPSKAFSLQTQAAYNTLFQGLDSTSFSGTAKMPRVDLGLTWFIRYAAESFDDPGTSDTLSDQIRFTFGVDILPKKLRLDGQVNYDVASGDIQQQRYFLNYLSQCWGVTVEGREYTRGLLVDRDYRISITLKNVGTFLDISGGDSNSN
ncbi:MAG: LPS assembly protein LptD [Thermoanaerobaculia bacterium]